MTDPRQSSGSFKAEGGSFGRDVRLIFGAVLILLDLGLLYLEHVHAVPPATYTTADVVMHVALLLAGLSLMDPKRTRELVSSLKDRLPMIGGGK